MPFGEKVYMDVDKLDMSSNIKTIDIKEKEKVTDISEADIIIACGRAF